MFLGGIYLIFVGRGGKFEFLRGLHRTEILYGNSVMAGKRHTKTRRTRLKKSGPFTLRFSKAI